MAPSADAAADATAAADGLYRAHRRRIIATLVRLLGHAELDLIEEAVQDAFVAALRRWPYHGVPAQTEAWLTQVARNRALDVLRRRARHDRVILSEADALTAAAHDAGAADVAGAFPPDDELRLILLCCHPALSQASRVALTLSVAAGFGTLEIARALLADPTAVAQRLVRAKRVLRRADVTFDIPDAAAADERLDAALEVMYLLFNEGYAAYAGDRLVRLDLCREAIRLTALLADWPATAAPHVHALLALMLLHGARLSARTDAMGHPLLLAEQDRGRWDRAMISAGVRLLDRAATGDVLSRYHVEAAIAAAHAVAPTWADTDWPRILRLYDTLCRIDGGPVVTLNRAVAVAMVHGPAAGIAALAPVLDSPALRRSPLLHTTLAELYGRLGDPEAADCAWRAALERTRNEVERRWLERRIAGAGSRAPQQHP